MEYEESKNVKSKKCNNCDTMIYWNVLQNKYYDLATSKPHNCPNWKPRTKSIHDPPSDKKYDYAFNRLSPNFKPKEEKPAMSNTFELLEGSPREVRVYYKYLSEIIQKVKGKVHGSQSHIDQRDGHLRMIIYYEVPVEELTDVESRFQRFKDAQKGSG